MKQLFNLIKNNKGSGIVTVLVAVLFLSAFGTLSLYLAYTSTEMVASERKGKEASYNAETCMEEIKAGLQITVSDAIAQCYNDIMPKYTSFNKDISEEFNNLYLDKILDACPINYDLTVNPEGDDEETGPASNKIVYYDGMKLFSVEKEDDEYKSEGTYSCDNLHEFVKEERKGRCEVYSESADNKVGVLEVSDSEILIKDLTVSYVADGGRKSSVTSDISIGVPNLGYLMTQYSISGIPDFSLICKGTINQNQETGKKANLYGSAYANKVDLSKDNQLVLGNGGTLIVRDSIDIEQGDLTNDRFKTNSNTALWTRNINIKNSTKVSLLGQTYVNNDLKFNGTGSSVTLSGTYYGFGCDESNPDSTSSIIFNHATEENNRNNLDIKGLSNLTLAGISFVSNSDRFSISSPSLIQDAAQLYDNDGSTSASDSVVTDGIGSRTGMSMDAKFNQIIYFAPKGEVKPYYLKTGDFEVGGETKTLIYLKRTDEDGTNYFADYNDGNPVFYKSSDSGLVSATGVDYDPQVEAGVLETDADGMSFYTEEDLAKVAYFALNGEEYSYNSSRNEFVISHHSDAALPEDTGLGTKKYSDYGITLQPIYEWLSGNVYEVTFFMQFNKTGDSPQESAQANANRYFIDYFNASDANKQRIINNIKDYTNIIDTDNEGVDNIDRRTVGNTISNINGSYRIVAALEYAFESIKQEAKTIKDIFDQYCISLANKSASTSQGADNPYNYYIDEAKIFADLPQPDSELKFYNNGKLSAVIHRGDYTYTASSANSDLNILIATGNIYIKGRFNGLIIAGGDVILNDNCTLSKYAEGVAAAYNADTIEHDEGSVHDSTQSVNGVPDRQVKDYFQNAEILNEFMYSASRTGDAWNVEGLVSYKNWHR